MLDDGRPAAQLKEWVDRLAPVAAAAREALAGASADRLALRSGCELDGQGNLRLALFGQALVVSPDGFSIHRADSADPASSFTESLVLTYLASADGTVPSGRWIGFRELPDGLFYADAFQGYSGARLVRELCAGLAAFCLGCQSLGGERIDLGDAAYAFAVLPRLRLALAYWEGDEEFEAQARVLFDSSVRHYMPTDGLAILGSQLVGRLLETLRVKEDP